MPVIATILSATTTAYGSSADLNQQSVTWRLPDLRVGGQASVLGILAMLALLANVSFLRGRFDVSQISCGGVFDNRGRIPALRRRPPCPLGKNVAQRLEAIFAQAEVIREPADRVVMLNIARPARPFSPSWGQRCCHPPTAGYSQKAPWAGPPMKRALRSALLGLMYIGVLLAIPGLVIGMACDKAVNALYGP